MKKKELKQKVYAFIDSQNLNLGVLHAGWKLDFGRFRVLLRDSYGVEEAFLFIGHVEGNERMYAGLQRMGYVLVFKPTSQYKQEGKSVIKGNVDAELVLHAMIEYPNYDKGIIVSGDGDFHCLIEYLAENEKLAKVIVPNNHYSSLLRKFAKYIVKIDQFRGKVEKH